MAEKKMEIRSKNQPALYYFTIGLSKEGKEIKLFRSNRLMKRRC